MINCHFSSIQLHPIFQEYQDTVLIVDKGKKKISSTVGHGLMQGHTFALQRFEQTKILEMFQNRTHSWRLGTFYRSYRS